MSDFSSGNDKTKNSNKFMSGLTNVCSVG